MIFTLTLPYVTLQITSVRHFVYGSDIHSVCTRKDDRVRRPHFRSLAGQTLASDPRPLPLSPPVSLPLAGKGLCDILNQQSCDNHVRQRGLLSTVLGCVSCREFARDFAKYCFGSVLYSVPLQADC